MDDAAERAGGWWRSPRLIAAAACFVLGAAVLAVGLAPRLAPPQPVAVGGDLAELEGLEGPYEAATTDDEQAELIVYVTGAVAAPDVYRLPPGARVKDAVVAAGGLRADAAAEQVNLAEPLGDAQQVHVPTVDDGGAQEEAGAGANDGRIDLNRASATELEELPGVGKVLAERIVAHREERGPYTSIDDLREVSGVGARLLEQIAPLVHAGD